MSIGSIGPSLTARIWHLFLPKRLLTPLHPTCFQQLSRQSTATACFNNSNGSGELSIKIVDFHPTEAGFRSKLGRISPGVYMWHQKQSTLKDHVVIFQCVWLVSWKHRCHFWFLGITLFERLSDKISSKGQVLKIAQKFCNGRNSLISTK